MNVKFIITGIFAIVIFGASLVLINYYDNLININELESNQPSASGHMMSFSSDANGFYTDWCLEENGEWVGISCYFETKTMLELAKISLDELENPKITGNTAQNICTILDLECLPHASFQAAFNPEDGFTKFDYATNSKQYFFRIIGDEIEYTTSASPNEWTTFGEELDWIRETTRDVPKFSSYTYEDICGFPVTDIMRLETIYDRSTGFTNDGLSYLKVRDAQFTHVEIARYYDHQYPTLKYWFTLHGGKPVYLTISACNLDEPRTGLGEPSLEYLKIKPETGETNFKQISAPGFPMVNTVTMKPVLDVENCNRMSDYYTRMQSHTMFTAENVHFDPIWKEQVFPLMDYCNSIGSFDMETIDGKINWNFTV